MIRFVPDHVKCKKMCKHADEKLPLFIKYVRDEYKAQ